MSEVRLILGDCLKVLPTLDAGSVDCVLADPPYGMAYQSAWRTESERFDPIANDEQPFVWWLHEAARVLSDNGVLLCFCRWDSAEAFRLAIGWSGLTVVSQIIWDRVIHGMGDPSTFPAPQHDTVWFARKGRFTFPDNRPKSVVRYQRLGGDEMAHPNEKPVSLMLDLIRSYCPDGGTVCDPFTGVSPVGVACVQTGRNFIGIEIDPTYYAIAERRIAEASNTLWTPPKPKQPDPELYPS